MLARTLRQLVQAAPKVTVKHITHLLSIPNRTQRRKFELWVGKNDWTPAEPHQAIQSKLGKRRKGGRHVKARSALDAIRDLQQRVAAAHRVWLACHVILRVRLKKSVGIRAAVKKLITDIANLDVEIKRAGSRRNLQNLVARRPVKSTPHRRRRKRAVVAGQCS
jgi:hypothetical protein